MTVASPLPTPAPALSEADEMAWARQVWALNHRDTPVPQLVIAIRTACLTGLGHWQDPGRADPEGRPATHLYEIAFLGQTASGCTPEQAAVNWRKATLAQIGGQA